jgi:hypothetical protein
MALDQMGTHSDPLEEMLGQLSRQVMSDGRYEGGGAMRFIDASHALYRASVVLDGVDMDSHLLPEQLNDAGQVFGVPEAADPVDTVVALVRAAIDSPTGDALHQVPGEQAIGLGTAGPIADDLNDLVIQPIFAATLLMQSALQFVDDPAVMQRIEDATQELDKAVRQIRNLVFGLETSEI